MEIFGLMIEFGLNGGLIIGICSLLATNFVKENAMLLIDDIKKKLEESKMYHEAEPITDKIKK